MRDRSRACRGKATTCNCREMCAGRNPRRRKACPSQHRGESPSLCNNSLSKYQQTPLLCERTSNLRKRSWLKSMASTMTENSDCENEGRLENVKCHVSAYEQPCAMTLGNLVPGVLWRRQDKALDKGTSCARSARHRCVRRLLVTSRESPGMQARGVGIPRGHDADVSPSKNDGDVAV